MQSSKARWALALLPLVATLGCQASVQGDASAEVTADSADAELDAEVRRERAGGSDEDGEARVAALALDEAGAQGPLLGARRDLALAVERASLSCSCLKMALGQPADEGFRWKGERPAIDETQLVVGLSSDGVSCKHPKDSLGASYWGYRQSGNDVIVLVESARKGRPVTAGAIIPKPFGDGQVYAAPAFSREPYGRGINGEAKCKLGNPGPPRSSPPVPAETP